MKICLSVISPNIESLVDARFGRSHYFLIADEKGEVLETFENPGIRAIGGAGITAAQVVASKNVDAILTGNLGPRAFDVLGGAGIKIFTGFFNLTAKEALQKYMKGELKETLSPNVGGHFGLGEGKGHNESMEKRS